MPTDPNAVQLQRRTPAEARAYRQGMSAGLRFAVTMLRDAGAKDHADKVDALRRQSEAIYAAMEDT